MSHSKTKKAKSQFRSRRRVAIILAAISLLAIAAMTVASSQLIASKATTPLQTNARHNSTNPLPPVKVARQDPQVAGQTGQVKPLTQEEAQRMGEELKSRLNRSTDGLVEQRQPDGSVSMDLQGRFQSVVLARRNEDGSVAKSCVDNPRAAAAFLGIDPKLVGAQSPTGVSKTPIRSAPVKN